MKKLLSALMFSLLLAWGLSKLRLIVVLYPNRYKILSLFSSTPSASSLATEPGWQKLSKTNYLPPSIKTARSTTLTSTRIPWEESPYLIRPPSVTLTEGSPTSKGPGGLQFTATPSEGSSTTEEIRFKDNLGGIVPQSKSSLLSKIRGQYYGADSSR